MVVKMRAMPELKKISTMVVDKFKTEAAAAAAANPADLAAFQAEFGNLTKNCGACHETYRIKKE